MSRFRTAVPAVLAACAALASTASAHKGDPNHESLITARSGLPAGLTVEVVNRDDSLQLVNRSRQDVIVLGYEDPAEPYARIAADGTVAINENSKATYLNEDRLGRTAVPDGVDPQDDPEWRVLDRIGRFVWHDHRIHWMGGARPPQVKDPDVLTRIFPWKVDLQVGGRPAAISGVLNWTPGDDGGAPVGAIAGFVALLLAGGAAVVVTRRRRAAVAADGAAAGAPAPREEKESW